jgi:hypothetical protein
VQRKSLTGLTFSDLPLTEKEEAEDYFWAIWDTISDIASSLDVTSEIQEHIITTNQALTHIAKGNVDSLNVSVCPGFITTRFVQALINKSTI